MNSYPKRLEAKLAETHNIVGDFCPLFAEGVLFLGLTAQDLAEKFSISVPTTERWKNGTAAPAPGYQRFVLETMLSMTKGRKTMTTSKIKRSFTSIPRPTLKEEPETTMTEPTHNACTEVARIKEPSQPMQPLVRDPNGTIRFKQNKIVDALLDHAREGKKLDLNDIARMDFSQEDYMQLGQLIGYSASAWAGLSTTAPHITVAVDAMADKMCEEDLSFLDPSSEFRVRASRTSRSSGSTTC